MHAYDTHQRCLLLYLDAKGYGANDDLQQDTLQRTLVLALDEAAALAGLRRQDWRTQPGGDSELAILPAGESEAVVVDHFTRELRAALDRFNHDRLPTARLRLRLAVHVGMAGPGENGYTGRGVVAVSRLADCEPLRGALAAVEAASLAVILSRPVFVDTVLQRHTTLRDTDFRRVAVKVKEYEEDAWITVPGFPVPQLDEWAPTAADPCGVPVAPSSPSTSPPAPAPGPPATVSNVIADVRGHQVVIGVNHDHRHG